MLEAIIIIAMSVCFIGYAIHMYWKNICRHEWKIIRSVKVQFSGGSGCTRHTLQCNKCGDLKFKRSDE